jgi:hypothetical protein
MPGSSEMSRLSEARKAAEVKGVIIKRIVATTSKMIPDPARRPSALPERRAHPAVDH